MSEQKVGAKNEDKGNAMKWLILAAEQGAVSAQFNLASKYHDGEGVPQDLESALKWYTRAAERGDAAAQIKLAKLFYFGEGVLQDYKQAVNWFTLAAEQSEAEAHFYLGLHYSKGQGVLQDRIEGMKRFKLAAEQGNPIVCLVAGDLYRFNKDYEEAVRWYELGAELGISNAQFELGNMYYKGEGVPIDYKEAVKWLTLAAEQEHPKALSRLQEINDKGT